MKKIVIVQDLQLTTTQKEKLRKLGEVTEYIITPGDADEWFSRVQWQDIILSEENYLFENIYKIKDVFLTFPFSGFLRDVDLKILKKNNVISSSAKGGNKYAVAERVVTALLNLTRYVKGIQNWYIKINPAQLASLPMTGIYGMNILILGRWNIWLQVGKVCETLGSKIDFFIRWDDLSNKINNKNIIINCLSENEDTKKLLVRSIFEKIGVPFYYVTAMRDSIHDSVVIAELLNEGKIIWYADDCASQPSGDIDNQYYKNASMLNGNTFITPHVAWASKSGIYYSNEIMVENIEKYIAGYPQNLLY